MFRALIHGRMVFEMVASAGKEEREVEPSKRRTWIRISAWLGGWMLGLGIWGIEEVDTEGEGFGEGLASP